MLANINSLEATYNIRETNKVSSAKHNERAEKEMPGVKDNERAENELSSSNMRQDKLEISNAASDKFNALKSAPLPGTNFEPKADPSQLGTPKGVKVDSKA